MGLDLVAEGEIGAGVASLGGVELVAEGGEGLGAAGCGERVEADEQFAVAGDDVTGGGEGFADEGAGLVAGPGVVAVQGAGQGHFRVVGGHPDGMGDLLDLGVQADHVGGKVAEPDPGRDGCRGLPGFFQLPVCGPDRGAGLVEHLVGDGDGLAGGGAAQREQRGVPSGFGVLGEGLGPADLGGGGLLRRVRHQPARVVRGGGVGVEGVEGEPGPGVAEVVILPPPRRHPPAHLPGVQVPPGGQDADLPGGPVAGGDPAGDLPQPHRLALARPLADRQLGSGVGQVVVVIPAAVVGAGDLAERVRGKIGGGLLAPGEQVEPSRGDVGEQGRGPAAPVEADGHTPAFAHDGAQLGEQPAQLAGQRLGRLGGHHEHRVAAGAGDPGLHGGRGGELQPRDVGLLHGAGAVVGAGVAVHVEEPEGVRPGLGVPAGQRHDQVRGPAGGGELAELAADGLDLRGPVQAQHPAQRGRRDPGGALGAGLAGQGQEYQRQQRGGQPVVPVLEPAVDLAGAAEQASRLQGGQREQQPGQRVPGAGREHRPGALAEQAPAGQRPLSVPPHRVRQHRNRLVPVLPSPRLPGADGGRIAGTGGGHPAERAADAERQHPGRRRDLPQRLAPGIQVPDPGHRLRRQLGRLPRAAAGWHQPGHPAAGQRPIPPPDRGRVHPEPLRHLGLRRGPQPDQLHRGQPPARLVGGVPGERGQPVHGHQPAVRPGHQPDARGDLLRPGGQQRQHRLGEHATHHPPHPRGPESCNNFLTYQACGRSATRRKMQISPAQPSRTQALCQES